QEGWPPLRHAPPLRHSSSCKRAGSGLPDTDPLVQDLKWRNGGRREWRRILRKALSAGSGDQERSGAHTLLAQARRLPIDNHAAEGSLDADQARDESLVQTILDGHQRCLDSRWSSRALSD